MVGRLDFEYKTLELGTLLLFVLGREGIAYIPYLTLLRSVFWFGF